MSGTTRFIESYASNNTGFEYTGPIEGVKVYVQWREGAGNADFPYSYSPIYYSTADAQGNFSIDMKPYFDSIGRVRYFEGRVDAGAPGTKDLAGNDSRLGWREKVRIWAELPDGTKADYRLINHYATSWLPADPTLDNTVMATWDSGKSSIRGVYINYAKNTDNVLAKPDRNDWAVSGEGNNVGKGLDGSVGGTVFWNANVPNGAIDFSTSMLYQGGADYPLSGITIQGSYLSDEAVAAIKVHAAAAFAGKTLRGNGWTATDENSLQAWISEQIKADPTWVAETVTATTGADGKYQLYFRGIYGNSADACGITGDKCHKLADSWDTGSFLNGNLQSKHTNWDWMYVAPVDLPNNVGVMSPWSIQRWQRVDGRGTWNGANFGQVGFAVGGTIDSVTLADILLSPAPLEFDVVNYDTQLNPAAPGDTAKTYTGGVLTNENLTYDIVWTDQKGNQVHECTGLTPDTNLSLASCDYQVPADLTADTVYTATLYGVNDGQRGASLGSDAFLATRGTELPWGSKYSDYDEEALPKAPDGTTLSGLTADGVPDGLSMDPDTGKITGKPTETGRFLVKVTGNASVPRDGADPVDVRLARTYIVVVTDTPLMAGVRGTEYNQEVTPTGFEDSGYTLGEIKSVDNLPAGLTYNADTKTITGTPTEIVTADEQQPNVTVTYTVTRETPNGTETKDVTDIVPLPVVAGDSDGDGVPDPADPDNPKPGEDQCPDTPKGEKVDENGCSLAQLFEPAYADSTAVAGGDPVTVSPTFTKKDTDGTVDAPAGTTFALAKGAPDWASIDANTGEITFAPGADVPAGDVNVPVVVTYPDNGGTDAVNAKVTVTVTDTDGDNVPDGKDQCPDTPEGAKVDETGCAVAPSVPNVPEINGEVNKPIDPVVVPVENPGKATDLVCTAKGLADGLTIAYDAEKGACVITGTPTAPIDGNYTVTVEGKTPDSGKEVNTSNDGKITVTEPEAPKSPDWGNGSGKPGETVVIPNDGGPVPDGTTVETDGPGKVTIDENGNVVVDIDKDAKPGDKIVVIVKDKDGNEIDKIEVTVTDPDKQPEADKPNWGDGSVKPGETVVIPNDGGKVPGDAKVTVEGPGKAQIDKDGNLVITADPNAKPGDKITVTVTDKDGNVLDTSTITVAGKTAPKSGTGKLSYTGATVGGLAAAATMLTAAGAFLVSRKRRED
ncbi:Rib/alpha-like domain-containing protein [Trueperella bernardiae]|uniref:Rib/alpha-like domain-containing protein n=1 Tax=Trueperella bernardiae TaxID=59561 RepID=A0AAW6ZM47_9ACTO|nr:Rib/alpha-like domain-containing protein [Trueperella bernardiae]MDK8601908.1 Rib/alpha-like domain-containing protein [Trueperella bernardiae]